MLAGGYLLGDFQVLHPLFPVSQELPLGWGLGRAHNRVWDAASWPSTVNTVLHGFGFLVRFGSGKL